ncbi:hypothetical protein P154DRAFT_527295, partial [Amniculicola lignicola CBS 123094]
MKVHQVHKDISIWENWRVWMCSGVFLFQVDAAVAVNLLYNNKKNIHLKVVFFTASFIIAALCSLFTPLVKSDDWFLAV